MNIAIIISRPEMGGAQRVAINLADWLNKTTNHKASIIALSHLKEGAYNMSGRDYYFLQKRNKIAELRNVICSVKADIVLTMGVPLCIYTIPATVGLSIKHIVSERNDPAHFAGKRITAIISRALMRLADGFVFQTKDARDFYGEKISKKSTIIPNPLFDMHQMPSKIYSGERKKNIVSVGRLNPQKNHILLIDAFCDIHKEFPEYRLEIWGEGQERYNLEQYINEKNLNKCITLPGVSNQIFDKLYDSSLFVLSSNFEGMPNALIEAMALGLPVISTDCPCGGPSFLISNKVNGILVKVGDKNEMVNAMRFMLNNKDKAISMGENAFLLRERLSEQTVNKQWFDYFVSILKT